MRQQIAKRVLEYLMKRTILRRPADVVIGGNDDPYLHRWHVIPRNRFFNIYLHLFLRSDDDRALHTHPWWNLSFLLDGEYLEVVPRNRRNPTGPVWRIPRVAGDVAWRRPSSAHRIELDDPCWSLFLTGPRVCEWYFHCKQGPVHWKVFTAPGRPGEIGRGCE